MSSRRHGLWLSFLICIAVPCLRAQSSSNSLPPDVPELKHRPPPRPPNHAISEGKVHLDITVSDANGRPVTGLQPWNFKLLDNGSPRKIVSFRAFSETAVRPDPPVEVILVIDELNLSALQMAYVRDDVARYLRRSDGRLEHPVSLMVVSDTGLRVQPQPALDGNMLLRIVKGIGAHISTINPATGGEGALERFQMSVHQIESIAENEANRPGRKLLIWVGPGWPMLERPDHRFSDRDQRLYFDAIVELTTKLREARIVVNSVAPADPSPEASARNFVYQEYVKGVASAQQADSGNLALKVLAAQTGGMILGPDNDVEAQIERCVANADAFYRISFDPPAAAHPDEYHEVKVEVDQPGLTVKTNSSYYNQPSGN